MKSSNVLLVVSVFMTLTIPDQGSAQYMYDSYSSDSRPYVRVGIGPAFTQNGRITEFTGFAAGNKISYHTGLAFDGAIGWAFNPWIAAELETGIIANEISHVQGFSLHDTFLYNVPMMANVTLKYHIPRTIVTPYVGAGVGGSVTGFDTDYFSNGDVSVFGSGSDLVFAYQFYAGVRFAINEQMSVAIGYKYFATDDAVIKYDSFFAGDPELHLGIQGVRTHVVTVSFNMKF
jgi:opacity protein-like surface antigen